MLKIATNPVARVTPWTVLALAAVVPVTITAAPARAQDFFGFFRPFSPPVAPSTPFYQPPTDRSPFTLRVRPRRKVVRAEKPPVKASPTSMPLKSRDPGEIENPVPALLADGTLRPGDLVMFPGGVRVFTGRRGDKHVLADFEPVSSAGKAVSVATRKLTAPLRPSENDAWSVDEVKSSDKLATTIKDVQTTGSSERSGH